MRKRENKLNKYLIFIAVLFMVIGYASVFTTLDLVGNISIGFNFDDVNIYIANLYSNNINKFNSISDDKMGFNIELKNGTNNIDVYVANNATQYDEYISFRCNNEKLDGVTLEDNQNGDDNIVYSQMIKKKTLTFNNTKSNQTVNCKLEKLEVESTGKTEQKKKIIFGSDGDENVIAYKYLNSMTYGDLPVLERKSDIFLGWFDVNNKKVESNTQISSFADEVLYAKFSPKEYRVTINVLNGTSSASSIKVNYGSNNTVTIRPSSNYYIGSVSCTNGYTTNASVGVGNTGEQTITISNNNNDADSVCTIRGDMNAFKLYNMIKDNASNATINFADHSGISGTNGIYTTTLTEGNVPVYYYRGKVNNNLIFNNMCWRIIRTTETGGIKLIYRGSPTEDGKCNKPNFKSGTEKVSTSSRIGIPSSEKYYFGTSYTFDEEKGYSVAGTITSGIFTNSNEFIDKYTCLQTSPTNTCTTIYRITGYSSATAATYASISVTANTSFQIGTTKFNANWDDNADIGYMYGTRNATTYASAHTNTNNSTIKTYIDDWYKNNFNSTATAKLEDTVFCNDRSTVTGTNNNTLGSSYGTLGYGKKPTGYGALSRSSSYTVVPKPTYKCPQANDKFTLKTTQTNYNSSLNGNKKLDYPVGLITLDEAIFAGFNTKSGNTSNFMDKNNYLYTGAYYWTLSPVYSNSSGYAYNGYVQSGGLVGYINVGNPYGVRPVVSLKSGTMVTGTGAPDNPYVVQ